MLELGTSKISETLIGNTQYAGELLGHFLFYNSKNKLQEQDDTEDKRFYFKAKIFKIENLYHSYYKNHKSLRMIDYQIAVYDT